LPARGRRIALLEVYARRLQVQERLTRQVAAAIDSATLRQEFLSALQPSASRS
jgi:GTP cyclohydrolase I